MARLVLAGGGHAQLSVLHALARHRPDIEMVLVTPEPYQIYSGMLPGWMAGHYKWQECRIDLRPLAQKACVKLHSGLVTGLDADRRHVVLSDGSTLHYDFLSIDVGGESDLSWLRAAESRLLPVRPIVDFVRRWQEIIVRSVEYKNFRIAVVGGGAAGVELVLAAQYALMVRGCNAEITLVASEKGVLSGHAHCVSEKIRNLLKMRGIALLEAKAAGAEDGLLLGNGQHLPVDLVIASTGSIAPHWLKSSNLELDERGYIAVDASHRSVSHPEVFAAGDVCSRTDTVMERSGVHAVFAGPVVARNLLATFRHEKLVRYQPRRSSLYLLATGPKYAVASWGRFSAEGRWVWRWKNWIDRRFMNQHKSTIVNQFHETVETIALQDRGND